MHRHDAMGRGRQTLRPQGSRAWAARARALGAAEEWPEALKAVERAKNLLPHEASQSLRSLDELERAIREAAAKPKRAAEPAPAGAIQGFVASGG